MKSQLDAMQAILGDDVSDAMGVVRTTFDCMDVAEEEIEASECSAGEGQCAFGVLCPSKPLRGKSHDVYRAHCKEMIARVIGNEDTRPGTKVEVLCCLLGAALKAPLNQGGMALADWLFVQVFPEHPMAKGTPTCEVYEGQVAEDYAQANASAA